MSWQTEAKKVAAGKWVRFDATTSSHSLLFIANPKKVQKESTQKGREGEVYFQMSFPVQEDGEDRILEPNKSLLTQLLEEDADEQIIGRELLIKCLDPPTNRAWRIRPVGQGITKPTWTGKKEEPDEEEKSTKYAVDRQKDEREARKEAPADDEPPAIKEAPAQDDGGKEKFKTEVAKRTRKRKEAEKVVAETEPAGNGNEEHENGDEAEES